MALVCFAEAPFLFFPYDTDLVKQYTIDQAIVNTAAQVELAATTNNTTLVHRQASPIGMQL